MNDSKRPSSNLWSLYKMGGLTSALNSVFNLHNAQQMAFIRQTMKQQRHEGVFETPLAALDLVVFDLETTGFHVQNGDEIIAIGAIAVRGERMIEEETFFSLCNPLRPIPDDIVALTGIANEHVRDAPAVIDVLRRFFAFVGKRILVAHASAHDKAFLNHALWRTSKIHMTHRVLDTMIIAKWLEPQEMEYSLDALIQRHEIPLKRRHHALDDAWMTAQLWLNQVHQARVRNVQTLGELYAHLSQS